MDSCKPFYHISKQKYLERKLTYNNFTTILRQICNFNKINYTSQIKYDKSTYDIIYYIYLHPWKFKTTPLDYLEKLLKDTYIFYMSFGIFSFGRFRDLPVSFWGRNRFNQPIHFSIPTQNLHGIDYVQLLRCYFTPLKI